MLAYFIPTENRYVRTQGEAKKLGFGESTEIPTDKDGLLAFINDQRAEWAKEVREAKGDTGYVDDSPPQTLKIEPVVVQATDVPETRATPPKSQIWAADAVLARMDNPGMDVDGVIEHIAKMKGGYALKRVAGAVALRFEELSK